MSILDIILIVLLFLFFITGFWRGLIKSIGAFLGLILGIFIAGLFYTDLVSFVSKYVSWSPNVLNVIAFILIFTITARLVELVFAVINKIFKLFTIIPFLKTINRLAGGAFGLLQGAFFLGIAIYIYSKYAFWPWLDAQILASQIAATLNFLVKFILMLLPDALKQIEGLI